MVMGVFFVAASGQIRMAANTSWKRVGSFGAVVL
jgi:hypothetical protein